MTLPRVIACMIWYEESPTWLAATIASLNKVPVSHVVAVDGAYAAFPRGRARSGSEQHDAISEACAAIDAGLTLFAPEETWKGNEVEKRSMAFRLAELVAEPDVDWYLVIDADQIVTMADLVPEELAATELDAAMPTGWERTDPQVNKRLAEITRVQPIERETRHPIRILFRAVPGLRVVGNHWTYVAGDGRRLHGSNNGTLVDALPLPGFRLEHRTNQRDFARRRDQLAYYKFRDRVGLEELDVDNHQAERLAEIQAAAR